MGRGTVTDEAPAAPWAILASMRFDASAFHDRVLENGSITLGMLREVIRHWIATESASPSTR